MSRGIGDQDQFSWGGYARRAWLAWIWLLLLFAQSSIPYDLLPPAPPIIGWDKVVHMVLFGILAFLLMRSRVEGKPSVWMILLFCLAYGASDELHQLAVPGRYSSLYDWIADGIGAGIVVWVMTRIEVKKRRTLSSQ